MQAKVLYLFITLVCLSCLFGQQADDNLKLSDIEVIGKSKAFSDSVQKLEDDHALTGKTNLSAFSYIPHLEPVFFTEQVTYEKKVTQAFIQLLAGSDAFLKSSLMLVSDDYKLLKLKAGIQQTEFNDNFKNSGYSLSWLPEFRGYNTVISFENQKA